MRNKILLILAIVIPLSLAAILAYHYFGDESVIQREALKARKADWADLENHVNKATKLYRGKAGIIIKDLDTNWQIARNQDMEIPSASLVKVPIMMAYLNAAEEGKLKLSDTIELKQSQKAEGSGTLQNFPAGSRHEIEDLIRRMITESDNTATNVLIDNFSMEALNRYFLKFGLKHTNLSRRMMDFKSRKKGIENYTTAADMAYSLEQLYRGKFINKRVSDRCLAFLAEQKVNDRIPRRLPSNIVVAHKTGLENGVCHDMGIVYTEKGNFLICVLTKHSYTTARPTKKLISWLSLLTYNYYNGL